MSLDRSWDFCSHFRWGLLEAAEGEFVVADGYGDLPFMPITPNLAFYAGEPDQKISKQQVAALNNASIEKSQEYYFACSLEACPKEK